MGYISTEKVKEIRNEIKKAFPTTKFSIKRQHYSGVKIAILESNVNFEVEYKQVNEFYINENYKGQAKDVLNKINEIASYGVSYRETGDYGTQPSHYVWISIGEWDKPFKYKN